MSLATSLLALCAYAAGILLLIRFMCGCEHDADDALPLVHDEGDAR